MPSPSPLIISEVTIRNFRGITDLTMQLEPTITLLVGVNNAGKSRVLRAIGLALGGLRPEVDDFTLSSEAVPSIDVVMVPPDGGTQFQPSVEDVLASSVVDIDAPRYAFAYRMTILMSKEGFGARSSFQELDWDPNKKLWVLPDAPRMLPAAKTRLWSAHLVEPSRDLATEMTQRGTAIRRIMDDLEVPDEQKEGLQQELLALGTRIKDASGSLTAVKSAIADGKSAVGGLGTPVINALPPRLEELARLVSIELDHGDGAGPMPMRFHGSGPRSLLSIVAQRVLYERRIGQDWTAQPPHPVSLIEEPEAHLHPQMQRDLASLLGQIPGQVIVSSHAPRVLEELDHKALRILQRTADGHRCRDIRPLDDPDASPYAKPKSLLFNANVEVLKRQVERPFGDLLFASAIVIGDGASERAFLPSIIRHAIPVQGPAVVVIDPMSMSGPLTGAAIRFAESVGIPWLLFADGDPPGRKDVTALEKGLKRKIEGEGQVIWTHPNGDFEDLLLAFDADWCRTTALTVRPDFDHLSTEELLDKLKGAMWTVAGQRFVEDHSDIANWPEALQQLVGRLAEHLGTTIAEAPGDG